MKPNLFIPGAPKAGTTSFHLYLNQHPKIQMSTIKEPHNYAVDTHYEKRFDPDFHLSYSRIFCKSPTISFYGESSTIHMISPNTIERIKGDEIKPKVIFLLRDPIERIVSHYNWLKSLKLVNKPFLKEVKESVNVPLDPNKSFNGNYKCYTEFSKYGTYLEKWIKAFDQGNVLVLTTEELTKDHKKAVNGCFSFLGLSEFTNLQLVKENVTSETKVGNRDSVIRSISRIMPREIKDLARKSKVFQRAGKVFDKIPSKHTLSSHERKWLKDFLKMEVKQLEGITGREFKEWTNFY